MPRKVVVTCALTGVFTDPQKFDVPVTAKQMASEAKSAYDSGASIVHCHFRDQRPGKGHLPSWDPSVASEIVSEIRAHVPDLLVNCSTGILGEDISGPLNVIESTKPETAALNAGSLNYLKLTRSGEWAWPPILFDNPVDKVEQFISKMEEENVLPECECFDTGIVRSVDMFIRKGMFKKNPLVSFVMGVSSGMPANPDLIPILVSELSSDVHWQTIVIGREEVWKVHEKAIFLGGHVRTGVEDTFYLPDGEKTFENGRLVDALSNLVRDQGQEVASPAETRKLFEI